MRMWNVDPKVLCNKHLLGEHVEMHMFIGSINKNKSLRGFIDDGLVETQNIIARHDELVIEMHRRGMNHKSPLSTNVLIKPAGTVNIKANLIELARRCEACQALQEENS